MDEEKKNLNVILDKDSYIEKLREEIQAEREKYECLKKHHQDADSKLRAVSAELSDAKEKLEAIRAEKAELDLQYAARGGMIKAYEYALDAIARRDSKC